MRHEIKRNLSVQLIPFLEEEITLHEINELYMRQALLYCGGNKSQAATLLKLSRNTVLQAIDGFNWDELKGNLTMENLLNRNIISLEDYKRLRAKGNPL
jgi:DNA-binding NtrC family response regulator